MIMARRNYKVYADIGSSKSLLSRRLAVLDTGAGPNFIRLSELQSDEQARIQEACLPDIRDANKRPIKSLGTIKLVVQLGNHVVMLPFIVCTTLAAPVVLGCDYCDRFVEAIRPKNREVELDDGSTVPIVRRPLKRSNAAAPLPPSQEYEAPKGRTSPRIRVSQMTVVPPQHQAWITVTTAKHGLVVIQPNSALYHTHGILVANGIAQVEPNRPFKILVSNTGVNECRLHKNQVLGTALPHPSVVIPTHVMTADVLGISPESDLQPAAAQTATNNVKEEKVSEEETEEALEGVKMEHVPEEYRERLRRLLLKFSHMWNGHLGQIAATEHHIDVLPGTRPIAQPPYRAGPRARQIEQEHVDSMLEKGIIEPAQSAWASPVVLVLKADGSLRFCVDYRKLNAVTVRDTYPLPRMDECIDSLGEAKVFTTLDANWGYWQVPVAPKDRDKTAFVCHAGLYRFKRMPFGLTNAPATFQRAIDIILSQYKWKTCLVYLDDIIVYSRNMEDHFSDVEAILKQLDDAGISLKIKKCEWFTKQVKYLGHRIKPGTLEIEEAQTAAIREAKPPRTQTQLRAFLGLCNVYRRFVPRYSHVAAPLNALLKKGEPSQLKEFGEAEMDAFRTLKQMLTSAPVLRLPKPDLPFSVDTDSSDYQVGCALFQTYEDGKRYPIGYWSRSLHQAEKNYSVSEKECLAVVWALTTLRPYLQGVHFTVNTDHSCLRWLMSISDPSGRLMRWRLRLSEFDFAVKYKKGTCNVHADALSRLETLGETQLEIDDDIPCLTMDELVSPEMEVETWDEDDYVMDVLIAQTTDTDADRQLERITLEELLREQLTDAFCAAIRSRLNGGEVLPFRLDDRGILVRTVEAYEQIVIPHSLKSRVLHLAHYSQLSGHPGGTKLYLSLRRDFYWPTLAMDCHATAKLCATCARNRVKLWKKKKPLKLFPAKAPLEYVSIDILGELIRSKRGNRYLLVITDRFSKLVKTVPLKRITAPVIARAFIHHWVYYYGPPDNLLSDNGKQFVARFFQDVCRILGVKNVFTTTYHPQCNGQVERYNRTLLAALRHYISDHPKDWDLYTDTLCYAYNTQVHSTTKFAPFELVLSRRPPALPLEVSSQDDGEEVMPTPAQFHLQWRNELRARATHAAKQMGKAQERFKRNYDATTRPAIPDLQVGGHVFVRLERTDGMVPEEKEGRRRRHKLAPIATGPHEVVEFNEDTVVIKRGIEVERVSRDRVVNAPVQEPLVNAPNAPASADTTRVDTGERLPAQPLPKSEILDVPPIGYSVHTRVPLGIPNLGHGSVSPEFSESHHGAMPGDIVDVGATPVESATPTSSTPRDVSVSHDSRIAENAARSGKDTTVREEPLPAKEGERTVNDSSPNVDVRQTEENTVISEDIPESEKTEDDNPSSDATVSEAIVEGPHSKQKTVSADSVSAGAATKKGITPTLPATVSPDLERLPGAILRRTVMKDVTLSPTESNKPNVGLDNTAKGKRRKESRKLAIRRPSESDPVRDTVVTHEKSSSDIKDVERAQSGAHEKREPISDDKGTSPTTEELDIEREFVIERIVSHGRDDDNTLLFRVRWYGYEPNQDTWEPIGNLPRSHVLSYCKRAHLAIPDNIDDARVG